jgi:hypothetical protein
MHGAFVDAQSDVFLRQGSEQIEMMQETESHQKVAGLRVGAAAIVANTLHAASCGWGVLHGAEAYPASVGRDLDILVDPERVDELASKVSAALRNDGWMTSIIRRPWKVTQVIASRDTPGGTVAFEVDFIGYQMWRSVLLASGPVKPGEVYFRGVHMACDPWGGFVKRVLIQCLASNWKKVLSRPAELRPFEEEVGIITSKLIDICGIEAATGFIEALGSGDSARIQEASKPVRAAVLSQVWKRGGVESQKFRWLHDKAAERLLHQPHTPLLVLVVDSSAGAFVGEAKGLIAQRCRENLVFPSVLVLDEPLDPGRRSLLKLRRESAFSNLIIIAMPSADRLLGIIRRNDWIIPVRLKVAMGRPVWSLDETNEYPLDEPSIDTKLLPAIMACCHRLNSGVAVAS